MKGRKVQDKHKSTKKLTVCAMLASLGVILLAVGSVIDVADISMAVIASLLCIIAVIEYGGSAPWMIFGVTAILSLLLLPNKSPAMFYACFFGFYPILKEKLEKKPRAIAWVLKFVIFNICLAVMIAATLLFFLAPGTVISHPIVIAAVALACELIFILYDIALTRLISFYIFRLQSRFKFK